MHDVTADHGEVRTETLGHVLRVTVDRVKKRNAFTPKMMSELSHALTQLDETPDLWVGVLCFAGEHTTAGLDLPLFVESMSKEGPLLDDSIVDPFGLGRRCSKPLVCAVQGIIYTIGVEMMLACDIAVAADDCRFSQMEAKRGMAPFGGATFRYLQRTGWGNTMYHLLLCDEFGSQEALRIGLVQEVVPAGSQIARAMEIAEQIAKNAPLGIQATKGAALEYVLRGEEASIALIGPIRKRLLATEDAKEGMASFVERREARFRGR